MRPSGAFAFGIARSIDPVKSRARLADICQEMTRDLGAIFLPHHADTYGRLASDFTGGAAAVAWVPPLVQQVTHHPGNMTLLVRFARQGAGGYPLRTAVAAVGAALTVLPAGGRWVLHPNVQTDLGVGPWWAILVTVGSVALGAAATLVG